MLLMWSLWLKMLHMEKSYKVQISVIFYLSAGLFCRSLSAVAMLLLKRLAQTVLRGNPPPADTLLLNRGAMW